MELLKRPYAERYMEDESPHPCGGFFVCSLRGIYQLETKENSMETQKEVSDSKIITGQDGSKAYWILMIIGLLVYIVSFWGSGSDFFYALGVLVGAFVISRLLTFFYFLIIKGKSTRQQKITQAIVFLVMSVIFLIVSIIVTINK